MKKIKNLYLIAAGLLLSATVFAQAPQKMSYQIVIRNSNQALVSSTTVGMAITVLQGSSIGPVMYVETQTPTTSANGLASIEIGAGTVEYGSFAGIDWANGPYFIETAIDPLGGTNYTILGTSQLLSVPYALHANNGIRTGQADTIAAQAASIVTLQAQMDVMQTPQLYTTALTNITNTSAVLGGNIINSGSGDIRGVVWSTSPSPSIALNTKTMDGTGMGSFIRPLSGLTPNTTYYVRAYTDSVGTAYGNEISFTTLANPIVGQTFAGGIVFYIDNSGEHGLVAAPSDQSNDTNYTYYPEWGCRNTPITGADGTAIGTGNQNTLDILAGCLADEAAAKICANFSDGVYSDWFLPSKDELHLMYLNIGGGGALGNVGGFGNGWYCSSSEYDAYDAWYEDFGFAPIFYHKSLRVSVRAVRAF